MNFPIISLLLAFIIISVQAQLNPGARFVLFPASGSWDKDEFTSRFGAALGVDPSTVTVGDVSTTDSGDIQVDFTYEPTSGQTTIQLLTNLKSIMADADSEGNQIIQASYAVVSETYYGLPDSAAATSWFTFTIILDSSDSGIDQTSFKSLIASATNVAASRVYVIESLIFDSVFENITASFAAGSPSPPDLVALLRKVMSTSGSSAAAQIRAAFTIDAEEYIGFTPTIPKIIISVTTSRPDQTSFKSSIASAVGVTSDRVNVSLTNRVGSTTVWNFTFNFVDGSPSSLALTQQLQQAFFYTTEAPYKSYLAQFNSPFQYFEGLAPIVVATTTTTAVPLPSVRATFRISLTSTGQTISSTQFIAAINTATSVDTARLSVYSSTYDYNTFVANITLGVTPNTTATDPIAGDLLKIIMDVLASDPKTQARKTFEDSYPILGQTYYGYTPFQPHIWIVYTSSSVNTAAVLSTIATSVGVTTARIGDVTFTSLSSSQFNVSFRFTNPTGSQPTALALTVSLRLAFFNGDVDLVTTALYFESLAELTTQAPIVERNVRWVIRRSTAVLNNTFREAISGALGVTTARVLIVSNALVTASSSVTIVFTFTDTLDGTDQSRYNLTYDLMHIRFLGTSSQSYIDYLQVYDVVAESYGDWVTMETVPPAATNPIITISMAIRTSAFNIVAIKQAIASAVGTSTDRIETEGQQLDASAVLQNFSFQFTEVVNATKPETYVDFLYLLLRYKRDDVYVTYLQNYNISVFSFPNYVTPAWPDMPLIKITVAMNVTSTSTDEDGVITNNYDPVNLVWFKQDFSYIVSVDQKRFGWEDPPNTVSGRYSAQSFRYLPVAVTTQPTPVDLTRSLQYFLASHTGPGYALIFARYNITARQYTGLPSITDATPTTTRNPYLPPGPSYYSPYGPSFNRSGLTEVPALETDSGNSGLIYGIVFGCIGAIILAAGGTLFVKLVMNKGKTHKATKYAQV